MSSIKLNNLDNVAVLLEGTSTTPVFHKVATKDIICGQNIIKYGNPIGKATADIKIGEHVHTHNLKSSLNDILEYKYTPTKRASAITQYKQFSGFKTRQDAVGIRNDIFIIPTVGCINSACNAIAKKVTAYIATLADSSISGVYPLCHQFGCSQLGADAHNITELLASIALNGNASVVLFVGLGCENNQITLIKQQLQHHNTSHIFFLTAQDETDEVLAGFNLIKEAVTNASKLKREPCSYSSLKIGLKCGGSDALSGITANPLVGHFSDALIARGGSAVLTEVPEMFGAEHILMDKCKDKQTFDALVKLVNDYKMDYKLQGFNVYENPSPGNKAGGISTLEEKSLGCVQKAGQSNIVDVVEYGSLVTKQGLSILSAPGNDLIASTALGACGCQLVLFTTGRGTPFSTFVPTLKISSNTALFNKKANWIDYNAQGATIASFIDFVDAIINGKQQCLAEDNREIAFFKKGVTL